MEKTIIISFAILLCAQSVCAKSKILLEVSGKIKNTNNNGKYIFSEETLSKLEQAEIYTTTPWTRKTKFYGPKLAAILKEVGAYGNTLVTYGEDDYIAELPVSDVNKYHVILARKRDGVSMNISTLGPLWIIYPIDAMSSNDKGAGLYSKLNWQVTKIYIK